MTGRLNIFAAALALVLATGTVAEASAATTTPAMPTVKQTQTVKAAPTKFVHKGRHIHIAHLRHHKPHLVRTGLGRHVVKATMPVKTLKQAATIHRERHAMIHRIPGKTTTVVR